MNNGTNCIKHISASEKIECALLELMQKKAYKSISVSEMAESADVSRQAFYLNFKDKDDVLNKLFLNLFSDIIAVVNSGNIDTVENLVSTYTDIVEKHSSFLKILADNELGPFLCRTFVNELISRDPVLKIQKAPQSEAERRYINSFWVSAFADVYTVWLKNEMDTSKDELNAILTDIMTGSYFSKK